MPSQLALLLTTGFIAFLFWRDARQRHSSTGALWLPFFWIVIGPNTRFLSQWLNIFGFNVGAINVEDGSPIDATYYLILIVVGLRVLYRRRVNVGTFIRNNRMVTLYLAYCFLAILWSDFQFVAFKRWIKMMGDPIMALIVLTEPDLMESLVLLIKRCAFFLLPLSICFIKYFPGIGRSFEWWTGMGSNTGVTTNKNLLGFDCWILGAVLFWHFLHVWKWEHGTAKRSELLLVGGLLAMDLWLLRMAHSATSLVAFILSIIIMLFLGMRGVNKRCISVYVCAGILFCAVAGFAFGMFDGIIHLLGKNDTLTDRTYIWQMLWNWKINPLIGTGFESFWLGDRLSDVQGVLSFLNEAHNGYLETYLNLGYIGVGLVAAMLLASYFKSRRELLENFEWGRFRLAFLFAFIVYNWTEAAFRLNAFPFFMFFLIAIDYPERQTAEEMELVEIKSKNFFEPEHLPALPMAVNEQQA